MISLIASIVTLQACLAGLVTGITVKSSKGIENFLKLDLSDNLQEYIRHEEFRLKVIAGDSRHKEEVPFVQHKLQEFKGIHKDLVKNKTSNLAMVKTAMDNHPTSVMAVIRNFLHAWDAKLANKTGYGSRLDEFLKKGISVPLPTQDDLYRATAVVTFLQSVYNISKPDIVKGVIKGHQGTPLNAADCYYLGKISLEAKMVDNAIDWMRIALKSVDLKSQTVAKDAIFNVTDAMVILAKCLYKKGDKEEAIALLERATEIDPEDAVLNSLYLTHRFGRNVKLVETMDVESDKKRFFGLCANLSMGLSIRNKTKAPPKLKCRYKASMKTPYWRYQEEIVSNHPYISVIHDFLQQQTVATLLNVSHEKVFREERLPGSRGGHLWQCKVRVLHDFYNSAIGDVSKRVSYVTGLGVRQKNRRISLGEPVHIIDFGPGGTNSQCRDVEKQYPLSYMGMVDRTRLTTVTLFLSDTKEGGHLLFPELLIGIKPKKGMAVQVNNFKPSGVPETNLLYGICPVLVGRSNVLQKGIFSSGLDQNVLCGQKPLSTYFSVEKARGCVAGPCGGPNTYK